MLSKIKVVDSKVIKLKLLRTKETVFPDQVTGVATFCVFCVVIFCH